VPTTEDTVAGFTQAATWGTPDKIQLHAISVVSR
jgi:hypothetical protein